MWVKICGTTTPSDAQLAAASNADAVGFVFAPSKRRVDASQVALITSQLPDDVEKVGVFHAADADEISAAFQQAGLSAAQLHFAYDAGLIAKLRVIVGSQAKILQVISVGVDSLDEASLRSQFASASADPNVWAILLDASSQGVSGGTGKSFDWARVAAILDDVTPARRVTGEPRLILAGGLRQENVSEAIAIFQPFGVDAVSGVEASPGAKDPERVQAFIQTAKG